MDNERKISKGLVAGCLMMVVALTIWVININDTYSTDSSTTPKCKSLNGIEYKYVSNATNDEYGCCPVSDTAKIGSLGSGNRCFSNTVNGSCPAGYTVYNEGNCIANVGEIDNSACYYCTGSSVTGSNYLWSAGTPSATCKGGSWVVQENITSSDRCVTPTQNYEVTFNVNGGNLYLNGELQSRNVFKMSALNYASYTATKDDYTFKGWGASSACTSGETSGTINVKSDMTVYACFVKVINDYNLVVYLDANNTSGIVYKKGTSTKTNKYETTIKKDNYIDLTEYSAKVNGYTFKGWSLTKSCNVLLTKYLINTTNTFYACYNKDETPSSPSPSTPGATTYSAKFNPNGGKFSDGTTSVKTIKYTDKKYFTDNDIVVTKEGYTFLGWQNTNGDTFNRYIDKSDNGSTLTAVWKSNNSSGGGSTDVPNPDIGNEENCEYIYKDSCEIANSGYNCIKDENNCYIKGSIKQDDNDNSGDNDKVCTYYTKNSCEIAYSGYNCVQDSTGCFIRGSIKDNGSSEPDSNPNTGSALLYLSIIVGIATLIYTIYYASKIKLKEGN